MSNHAVVIAGAGPTGLMLAGELKLAGIDSVIVERRLDQQVEGSRAGGLHSRTIEVLDQRGIAQRFLDQGQTAQVQLFALNFLDISDFPTRHNYGLALWQSRFEPILAQWVEELEVPILRGRELVGFTQDQTGVDVIISDGSILRAQYLVGCDGGHSLVRKTAGIDFVGTEASSSWIVAEVEMDQEPPVGVRRDNNGTHALNRIGDGGPIRLVLTEKSLKQGRPGLDELHQALIDVYGSDFGLRSANWISRFTDMTRLALNYRCGRVLLAGDAAHIHPPHGGQGLNIGVQDAVNLGWKLAQVINEESPDSLLDTYHTERYPIAARVLQQCLAQVALNSGGVSHQALRTIIAELLSMDEPRKHIAAMLSGLDIRYELGEGHPLLGRRMPDLDIHTNAGPTRVYQLMHEARPLLINFANSGELDPTNVNQRIRKIDAKFSGAWELPLLGQVDAPSAVLIRPDGYVAWVGELSDPLLVNKIIAWFGTST